MYAAVELSQAVRTRRKEIGLSQQALALLSGLSRATIVQVEGGTIKDLSLTRTAAILDALGLGLAISPAHPKLQGTLPLDLAARTASVSYARPLTPKALGDALRAGEVPAAFEPHVGTLLEEAPVSLLARAVEQVHAESALPREAVWANMRRLARHIRATRDLWHVQA